MLAVQCGGKYGSLIKVHFKGNTPAEKYVIMDKLLIIHIGAYKLLSSSAIMNKNLVYALKRV